MDFAFVALYNNYPVACAHTMGDMEAMLAEYTMGKSLGYIPYPSKFPSANELEGTYYYKDYEGETMEFKIYSVEYKREKNDTQDTV